MKLPHFVTDDDTAHFLLLLLGTVNLLLIVVIFLLLPPETKKFLLLPKVTPISAKTPIVRISLISPVENSTVSGTVPLVTTLSNGPKIIKAELFVDEGKIQSVSSQKTEKLSFFWDTTKNTDGRHVVKITVTDDQNMLSSLVTSFTVKNNVSREVKK
ncbi:MAG: Ig-like domain-containing protein [bacterium]|nr:Ig-like domain-containing protein [bacterium]